MFLGYFLDTNSKNRCSVLVMLNKVQNQFQLDSIGKRMSEGGKFVGTH